MLLSDTSAHDATTLPSNGIRQLWRAYALKHLIVNTDACFRLKCSLVSTCLLFCFLCFFLYVSCCFFPLSSSPLSSSLSSSVSFCVFVVPCCFPREEGEDEGAHQFCCAASGCSSPSSRWAEVWLTVQRLTSPFTCEKTITVYAAQWRPHCVPKKTSFLKDYRKKQNKCMEFVEHCHWFIL